jgi:formylglycine-generating enzyme required for sulfatase activity
MSESSCSGPSCAGEDPAALALLLDQSARWQRGERKLVEAYLVQQPLAGGREAVLELILHEVLLRKQGGETPSLGEYQQRFPHLAASLAIQFEVEGAIDGKSLLSAPQVLALDPPPTNRDGLGVPDPHGDHDTPISTGVGVPVPQRPGGHRGLVPRTVGDPASPAPAGQPVPRRIGRYLVEGVLGEGSFGRVYLARDPELRRPVAIKVPHAHLSLSAEDVEAYLAEARILAGLDHPHIVPVHDAGRDDGGRCYVVSKYIEGCDLARRLQQGRPPFTEAARLVAAIAEALHHAHTRGLVHRDVKGGNILLDLSEKPYLGDFGLALREEDFGKGAGFAGTPAYMSPEQARGEGHRVDGRSDIFNLGVVFYELLAGRRPFQGSTWGELLEQVVAVEARPPRMIDDAIPKELERICLKALAKRASERYTTARDMADDLRHFLAGAGAEGQPKVSANLPVAAPPAPTGTQQPARVVPKGLRSFDAGDADFFLELLPGPRGRDGLPESVRFWKGRIEETDPDRTFAVGLIYGPSGCGKSSLVKAALLPRLAGHVQAVYVEATAEETEARLLRGLRKGCAGLPGDLGLPDFLAALRRGRGPASGQKVLIVLDQFEQWLHARRGEQSTELVQALRHCDGARVQCVVLVRDDFWMAATRFMEELEVRLVQGENCAAVDLFDPRHARKVLAAFGRAFGALPDNPSREGDAFLDQAVGGLAQDGKVISVRLAVFAEMVKGRAWTPATLKEVGGTGGVGVAFLEETFSAATAPPQHRLHQKAARAVLKALLPESGADIKGNMRSARELLDASGHAGRPRDFEQLLRILDGELRLVTPAEPEGDATGQAPAAGRCYQLTHDYLVPSLREWLTRKQKETRRGRAELLLADRAAVWSARPESRQLPSLLQWAQIRWRTHKASWTPQQRRMMSTAGRCHALRGLAAAVFLAALTLAGLGVRDHFAEQKQATHAAGLVQRLLDAEPAGVPDVINAMEGYRRWTDPLLRQEGEEAADLSRQRLHASLGLLPVDESQVDYLCRRLLDADPQHLAVIRNALRPHQEALAGRLWEVLCNTRQDAHRRFRAACALAGHDAAGAARWREVSPFVAAHLLAAVQRNPSHYTILLDLLRPVRTELLAALSDTFRARERSESERTWATTVLADYAADRPEVLADLLLDADSNQFAVLFPRVADHQSVALPLLLLPLKEAVESKGSDAEKEALAKRQANAAVTLLRVKQTHEVWPLLKHSSDPRARSYLIHRLAPLGAKAGPLVERLDQETDVSSRRALILALGELDLPPGERQRLVPRVVRLYREDADAGVHGAAEWLLRRWQQESKRKEFVRGWMKDKQQREARLGQIRQDLAEKAWSVASAPAGRWYVNAQGQTMVVVPGPVTFRMGSPAAEEGREGGPAGTTESLHTKRIARPYAIAAHHVTVGQLHRFRKDHRYNATYSPGDDHPANMVTWCTAAAYCNWLSDQEGIAQEQWCYQPRKGKDLRDWSEEAYGEGMKLRPSYLTLEGYRLPSEAEWENACRCGAVTSRYYGETEELLGKYAWCTTSSLIRGMLPVGSLKPNDYGLFDMLGNAHGWCQERLLHYRPELPNSEDREDVLDIDIRSNRVMRGGSLTNQAVDVRSAGRRWYGPANRDSSVVGFRPARTFR